MLQKALITVPLRFRSSAQGLLRLLSAVTAKSVLKPSNQKVVCGWKCKMTGVSG